MSLSQLEGIVAPYVAWNHAIARHFFMSPQSANRRVYLQVDSDALEEIAAQNEDLKVSSATAEEAFVAAVLKVVDINASNPFRHIHSIMTAARRAGRPGDVPLYIALLGFCVLAASKMHSDSEKGTRSTNYYEPLNTLLGRDWWAGMPPRFDLIVTPYWRDLQKWLDVTHRGKFGWSTITNDPYRPNVGYPYRRARRASAGPGRARSGPHPGRAPRWSPWSRRP